MRLFLRLFWNFLNSACRFWATIKLGWSHCFFTLFRISHPGTSLSPLTVFTKLTFLFSHSRTWPIATGEPVISNIAIDFCLSLASHWYLCSSSINSSDWQGRAAEWLHKKSECCILRVQYNMLREMIYVVRNKRLSLCPWRADWDQGVEARIYGSINKATGQATTRVIRRMKVKLRASVFWLLNDMEGQRVAYITQVICFENVLRIPLFS